MTKTHATRSSAYVDSFTSKPSLYLTSDTRALVTSSARDVEPSRGRSHPPRAHVRVLRPQHLRPRRMPLDAGRSHLLPALGIVGEDASYAHPSLIIYAPLITHHFFAALPFLNGVSGPCLPMAIPGQAHLLGFFVAPRDGWAI